MKPTIHCSECQQELSWGDQYCGNCGKQVEWPEETRAQAGKPPREKKGGRKIEKSPAAASWKAMLAVAVFIVAGVIILELLTGGTRNVPTGSTPPAQAGTGANMEAMNKLNELEQAANANPGDLKARLTVANFAHDSRFYEKAIQHYKLYLEKKPDDPDALVDLGICFNDLGNLDEARKYMEQALKGAPKHLLAHFNLGIVSLRSGDMKAANDWFKKTVALSPNSEIGQRAQQLLNDHLNAGQ